MEAFYAPGGVNGPDDGANYVEGASRGENITTVRRVEPAAQNALKS